MQWSNLKCCRAVLRWGNVRIDALMKHPHIAQHFRTRRGHSPDAEPGREPGVRPPKTGLMCSSSNRRKDRYRFCSPWLLATIGGRVGGRTSSVPSSSSVESTIGLPGIAAARVTPLRSSSCRPRCTSNDEGAGAGAGASTGGAIAGAPRRGGGDGVIMRALRDEAP